ncbi:MAG: hypothetical protein AAF066_03170 [Pseudomonadota bacterium]
MTPEQHLHNKAAIWNNVPDLCENIGWLHDLADKHAKTDGQQYLAQQLPGLLGTWQIEMQANAQRDEILDDMRRDHLRKAITPEEQKRAAQERVEAKGDPA